MAAKRPFTPQDLAGTMGFTPNRARQLLEELRASERLVILGTRKAARGKPAFLWGIPGTVLTEEDIRAKGRRAPRKRPKVTAASNTLTTSLSALEVLSSLLAKGVELTGPDGAVYRLSFGKVEGRRRSRPSRHPDSLASDTELDPGQGGAGELADILPEVPEA